MKKLFLILSLLNATLHAMDMESGQSNAASHHASPLEELRQRLLKKNPHAGNQGKMGQTPDALPLPATAPTRKPYHPTCAEECKSLCIACVPVAAVFGIAMAFAPSDK